MKIVLFLSTLLLFVGCLPYPRLRGDCFSKSRPIMIDPRNFRNFDLNKNRIYCLNDLPLRLRKTICFRHTNKYDTSLFVVAAYDEERKIGFYAFKDTSKLFSLTMFRVTGNRFYYDVYRFENKHNNWNSIYSNIDSAKVNQGIFGGSTYRNRKEYRKLTRRERLLKFIGYKNSWN